MNTLKDFIYPANSGVQRALTPDDYVRAGIVGVNSENLTHVNETILANDVAHKDSSFNVQNLVNTVLAGELLQDSLHPPVWSPAVLGSHQLQSISALSAIVEMENGQAYRAQSNITITPEEINALIFSDYVGAGNFHQVIDRIAGEQALPSDVYHLRQVIQSDAFITSQRVGDMTTTSAGMHSSESLPVYDIHLQNASTGDSLILFLDNQEVYRHVITESELLNKSVSVDPSSLLKASNALNTTVLGLIDGQAHGISAGVEHAIASQPLIASDNWSFMYKIDDQSGGSCGGA